jgi:hypothetical protein
MVAVYGYGKASQECGWEEVMLLSTRAWWVVSRGQDKTSRGCLKVVCCGGGGALSVKIIKKLGAANKEMLGLSTQRCVKGARRIG